MIVAYIIFVTTLCGAFSIPFSQYNSGSVSEIKLNAKRNARLQQGNAYDEDSVLMDGDSQIDRFKPKSKIESITWENIFTPKKLWSQHCEPNCPPQYYPDLGVSENNPTSTNDDDILLHLSANKDLMKFLQWTMEHLGSLNSYNASEIYYPGLNIWKKLNLSGRRELPLYVEEPQYIVVRREPDDLQPHLRSNPEIPFIPPRGRKYIPNLDNLMSRYELFVPNRGKKDKIKDIFKYDDLFFPNRGKKRNNNDSTGGGRSRYYYHLTENDRKKLHQPLGDCFTRCGDITSTPSPRAVVDANQVENINALVSAATLHLPPSSMLPVSSSASDANAADGHQDDVGCAGAAVAECQKKNDVKINRFDQSVKAQINQWQHSKGGASIADRRQLSSSSSSLASTEAGASSFLPLIRPADQLRRLQLYPIRNKQLRDYYF